jgi:hypothetical protein
MYALSRYVPEIKFFPFAEKVESIGKKDVEKVLIVKAEG